MKAMNKPKEELRREYIKDLQKKIENKLKDFDWESIIEPHYKSVEDLDNKGIVE